MIGIDAGLCVCVCVRTTKRQFSTKGCAGGDSPGRRGGLPRRNMKEIRAIQAKQDMQHTTDRVSKCVKHSSCSDDIRCVQVMRDSSLKYKDM